MMEYCCLTLIMLRQIQRLQLLGRDLNLGKERSHDASNTWTTLAGQSTLKMKAFEFSSRCHSSINVFIT